MHDVYELYQFFCHHIDAVFDDSNLTSTSASSSASYRDSFLACSPKPITPSSFAHRLLEVLEDLIEENQEEAIEENMEAAWESKADVSQMAATLSHPQVPKPMPKVVWPTSASLLPSPSPNASNPTSQPWVPPLCRVAPGLNARNCVIFEGSP